MADKSVSVRFSVKDSETVKRALQQMGAEGDRLAKKLEQASKAPAAGFKALNASVNEAKAGLQNYAGRAGSVGTVLSSLGSAGIAAAAGFAAVSAAAGAGLKAFAEAERLQLRLEGVLKATGNAAGISAQGIVDYADKIEASTFQTKESIVGASAVLATFKSVSGSTFKEAISLAADMAEVFGGDVSSSATQLGKALENPVEGLAALKRVGITFSDEQKKVIESLVETGKKAEAQRVILDALSNQIGGAAVKAATGLAGSFDNLKDSIGDVVENFGSLVSVTFDVPSKLGAAQGFFESLSNTFKDMAYDARVAAAAIQTLSEAQLVSRIGNNKAKIADLQSYNRDLNDRFIRPSGFIDKNNSEIASLTEDTAAAQKQLDSLIETFKKLHVEQTKVNPPAGGGGRGSGKGGGGSSAVDELKRENEERQKYLNGMVLETEQLSRLVKANEISAEAYEAVNLQIKIENELREKGILATSREGQQITELIKKQDEYNKAIQGMNDAREEAKRRAEEQEKLMQEPYLNAARGIQDAFSSTFEDIFSKGVDSFSDLADKVKSVMFKMAAEIAAAMVFRPVVGGVLGAATGAGVGASSSSGGGLGGSIGSSIFNKALGSVGNAFTGFNSSVGSALPSLFGSSVPLYSGFGAGAAQIGSVGGGALTGLGITPATAAIGLGLFALSSVFGKKKPSNKLQDSIIDFGSGSVLQGGQTGNKFSQENRDAADALTAAVQAIAGTLTNNLSQSITDTIRIAVGARSGYQAGAVNAETSYDSPEALLKGVTKGLVDGLKNVPVELQTALDKIDFKEVEQAVSDINFSLNFTKLGNLAETFSEVELAVKSLNAQFDETVKTANRLGLSEQEVNNARQKQLGYLKDNFNKSIYEQILGIADPKALQKLQIENEIDQLRKDAAAVGGDVSSVETLRALRLEVELKQEQVQLIEEQANAYRDAEGRWKSFASSLKSFREGLLLSDLSPLSPESRLAEARKAFDSISTRAQLGDTAAIEELQSASENLLRESKSYYASSEDYFRDFTRVQEVLSSTESLATRQASIASQQLSEAQKQTELLQQFITGTTTTAKEAATKAATAIQQIQQAQTQQIATQTAAAATAAAVATVTQAANSNVAATTAAAAQTATNSLQVNTGIRTLPSFGLSTSKIRGFADGGIAEGLAKVGERGEELVYFPAPARIFNNNETKQILSGSNDNSAVVAALNAVIAEYRAYRQQSARETSAMTQRLDSIASEQAQIRSNLSRAAAR